MGSKLQVIEKHPDAVLDYGFEWEDWLTGSDTITASTWTVDTGITEDSSTFTNDTTVIWLSGGTVGDTYEVANEITTVGGRTDKRTIVIKVVNR